jgi:glucosylceramidase
MKPRPLLFALGAGLAFPGLLNPMHAASISRIFVTAEGTGDRLAEKSPIAFELLPQPDEVFPTVMIDERKSFQTMVGIGGALTDAAAETYAKLPPGRQREFLTACFDPDKGIGYSLCRTSIHSCDFSSASYTYDDTAGDTELRNFSIAHDLAYRIPFIKAAMAAARGPVTLFASPWSPPAWMKTTNNMLLGGKLRPECAQAWAGYFVKFVQAYGKEGITIWGLTVQNEPMSPQTWESCTYTGSEERDFVRDHLGPALARAGLSGVRLMIWDHNRGLIYQRAKAVYDDPEAAKYVWGAAFHWYAGDHFDNVRMVHDAWPEKNLLFSEGCAERFDAARIKDWQWGEKYGVSVMRDLNNWAVGWTDWNVLLDERGGPNHVGNFCYAPVIADTHTGALTYMNSFYYLGHFSKFIRPGARRIAATSNSDNLLTTAFRNPDGSTAVVVLNTTDQGFPFRLWAGGEAATASSPAHSILTMVY